MRLIATYSDARFMRRFRQKVLPNLKFLLTKTKIRKCGCCDRTSIFLQFGQTVVAQRCLRCAANFRYEMLATLIRSHYSIENLDVIELDANSSLQNYLKRARSYTRSYFKAVETRGAIRPDGAAMQDITQLTYSDNSFDLIVSSDVLEHVPDALSAFKESYRVLRPGGRHVFTVPNEAKTEKLADVINGQLVQIVFPPEYHSDPLDAAGILAFWHFGPDIQDHFGSSGLVFKAVEMSDGHDRRLRIWEATRPSVDS